MSYSNKSNAKANVRKPFCKVCQDAGKSEREYTSHYTRSSPDKNSAVVCPTLLSMECRYCFKTGHTVKYCRVLEENNKNDRKANKKYEQANKPIEQSKKPVAQPKNLYSALYTSDSEEECKPIKKVMKEKRVEVEEYPALCGSYSQPTKAFQPSFSYASMASKTVDEYETEQYEKKLIARSHKNIMPKMVNFKDERSIVLDTTANFEDEELIDKAYEIARNQVIEEEREKNERFWNSKLPQKASEMDWAAVADDDDEW